MGINDLIEGIEYKQLKNLIQSQYEGSSNTAYKIIKGVLYSRYVHMSDEYTKCITNYNDVMTMKFIKL